MSDRCVHARHDAAAARQEAVQKAAADDRQGREPRSPSRRRPRPVSGARDEMAGQGSQPCAPKGSRMPRLPRHRASRSHLLSRRPAARDTRRQPYLPRASSAPRRSALPWKRQRGSREKKSYEEAGSLASCITSSRRTGHNFLAEKENPHTSRAKTILHSVSEDREETSA
ncbi:hypothetical protein CDD83_3140 [Cordyceps sp. RAO-2017]|nr:hypothetical protein CDD83_3140 [Cordyceps sp. RAO-2017]